MQNFILKCDNIPNKIQINYLKASFTPTEIKLPMLLDSQPGTVTGSKVRALTHEGWFTQDYKRTGTVYLKDEERIQYKKKPRWSVKITVIAQLQISVDMKLYGRGTEHVAPSLRSKMCSNPEFYMCCKWYRVTVLVWARIVLIFCSNKEGVWLLGYRGFSIPPQVVSEDGKKGTASKEKAPAGWENVGRGAVQ